MAPLPETYTQPDLTGILIEAEASPIPPDVWRKPFQEEPTGRAPMEAGAAVLPGGAASRRLLYGQYPPHIYPPPDAFMLDFPINRIPVVIVAGGSAVFALPRVPQARRGVVRKLAAVVTAGALADARFTTRINLAPVQPFPGVRGAIGSLELPQDTQIILAAGDLFDVLVENTGIAALTAGVRIYGWWWTDETA